MYLNNKNSSTTRCSGSYQVNPCGRYPIPHAVLLCLLTYYYTGIKIAAYVGIKIAAYVGDFYALT